MWPVFVHYFCLFLVELKELINNTKQKFVPIFPKDWVALNQISKVGVRREGTMRLKNCCKKKKDPPMQMKILKNDVLEDLEEEDEDVDDEDAVFK